MIYPHAAADRAATVAAAMSERLSARPQSRTTEQAVLDVREGAATAPSVPSEMGHAGGARQPLTDHKERAADPFQQVSGPFRGWS